MGFECQREWWRLRNERFDCSEVAQSVVARRSSGGVSGGWQATQARAWRQCTCQVADEKDRAMVIAQRELAETAIEAPWQ